MCIVIIGGHERMEQEYINISKEIGCKAKVFTKKKGCIKKCIGCPDAILLVTEVVSHKMATVAREKSRKDNIPLINCSSGSRTDIYNALRSLA